jgi:DNA polymerase-3 subunit alpha
MVAECKRLDIPVLPPDINESFGDFTAIKGGDGPKTAKAAELAQGTDKDSIRFGLYSIKNFGRGVADAIIEERKNGGKFVSLSDFLSRVKAQGLNKKGLEALIKCGALDSFGERGQMLNSIEILLNFHREQTGEKNQDSLFVGTAEATEIKLPAAAPATQIERLAWEKELLGLYISGHPLDRFKEKLEKSPMNLSQLKEKVHVGQTTIAAGMIEDLRVILTKGGDQMAFIKLMDMSGTIEAVVFPKDYAEHREILKAESCIALKGRLSSRNGELSLVAEKLKAL